MHADIGLWRYALYAVMVFAAWRDARSFLIPNAASLAALALLAAALLAAGAPLEAWKAACISGAIGLCIGYGLFAFGLMGGGDGKLFAAGAAWFTPAALLQLGFFVSLAGCALAVIVLVRCVLAGKSGGALLKTKLPYGVAIAAGTMIAGGL